MNLRFAFFGFVVCCATLLSSCEKKTTPHAGFTRADSLTETYLALQDTMVQAWNMMIHDDNRKIRAMRHLIQELTEVHPEKKDELKSYEDRLEDLRKIRYDQESIGNAEIIAEYDFASNSLVSDLVSMAELERGFSQNETLQRLVDSIRSADQRVIGYREEYDRAASRYNRFIENHKRALHELEEDSFLEEKPLFQMASE